MSNRVKIIILSCCLVLLFLVFILLNNEEPTTIEFAVFSGSNWEVEVQDSYSYIDRAISRFEKKHKGVRVKYISGISKDEYSEWISRRILSADIPDVMMIKDEDFNRFAELGVLENLDNYIMNDGAFERDKYYETSLKSGNIKGNQYALPLETVPYLMFVNKTLLNKEGIHIPRDNYTFDDLYNICKRVTKDTDNDGFIDQFGIIKYTWQEAAVANGVKLFSDDGKQSFFTSEGLLSSIKFIKALNELNENQQATKELFDNGRVAFMPLSYAEYRTYKAYPYRVKKYVDFEWDCIAMPKGALGNNISVVDSLNIGMSSKSKNKKLVWEFLKYMTGDEETQRDMFLSMPAASVLKAVTEREYNDEYEQIDNKFIGKVISGGNVKPKFERYKGAIQIADAEISQIYSKDIDLDGELRMIQKKVRDYITK